MICGSAREGEGGARVHKEVAAVPTLGSGSTCEKIGRRER
jgi:hypothetical protein